MLADSTLIWGQSNPAKAHASLGPDSGLGYVQSIPFLHLSLKVHINPMRRLGVIVILQMRKLRPREVKDPAQSHTTGWWQN